MKRPEYFLEKVWDKLSEKEKKETYLDSLIYSLEAPIYLSRMIERSDASLDVKITVAEKVIKGEELTDEEIKKIGLQTAD